MKLPRFGLHHIDSQLFLVKLIHFCKKNLISTLIYYFTSGENYAQFHSFFFSKIPIFMFIRDNIYFQQKFFMDNEKIIRATIYERINIWFQRLPV